MPAKPKDPLVAKSKYISLLLRHNPQLAGLTLDEAGWCRVVDLVRGAEISFEELKEIVGKNNKKRFEFSENGLMVRASQGHSVEVLLGYKPSRPPDILFHGTSKDLLDTIKVEGLKKMERHHVHMSVDPDVAEEVAKRRRSPVVLAVNAKEMVYKGHEFFLSTNGIWLTEVVPPEFLGDKWGQITEWRISF